MPVLPHVKFASCKACCGAGDLESLNHQPFGEIAVARVCTEVGMFNKIRYLLETALRRRGYGLRRLDATPRGYAGFLEFATTLGVDPGVVIDIGVGHGTPWLYEHYRGKKFILIEALRTFENSIQEICRQNDCDVHYVALGNCQGRMSMRVPDSGPTGSSFLERSESFEREIEARGGVVSNSYTEVEVTTLDSIETYSGPFVIKIDVEGFEVQVLEGALETLAQTQLLIIETSIMSRQVGEATLTSLSNFVEQYGFRLLDFVQFENRASDGCLLYCDVAYVNEALIEIR